MLHRNSKAEKISSIPKLAVDYWTVSIMNQEELDNALVILSKMVRQMKVIRFTFYSPINNPYSELNLFKSLESGENLQCLVLDMRGYSSFNCPQLHQIISKVKSIRSLIIKRTKSEETAKQFAKLIAETSYIRYISLNNAFVNAEYFKQFSINRSVQFLHLKQCTIDENTWKTLCGIISSTNTLKTIEVRPIEEPKFLTDFCEALKKARSIKEVITDSYLFEKPLIFEEFLSAIEQSPCESLTIVKYTPSPNTRSVLSNFIKNTKTLKHLQLGKIKVKHNVAFTKEKTVVEHVDQADIDALANALQSNKTLIGLRLNGWSTSQDVSMKQFAEMLKSNVTLLTLDMSYSYWGQYALKDISEAIAATNTLKKLNLRRLMSSNWPTLIDALIKNKSLTSVDLSESVELRTSTALYIENVTIELIKKLIENNTTLRELKFQAKNLSENEIVDLLPSLKHNDSLTSVDILAPKQARYLPNQPVLKLTSELVADVFSTNYSIVNLNIHFSWKRLFDKYLKRNRQHRVDLIVMLHNLFRSQYTILPDEIWRHIFSFIGYYVGLIDIVMLKK